MNNRDGFFDKLSQYINNLKKFLDDKFWDSSFLLKRRRREIKQTLQQIEGSKEDVLEQIRNIGREDIVAKQAVLREVPDGTMVVYIMLNIINGRDISAWEHALAALPSCCFGRPIYMEEKHVRRAISRQGDSLNSGYVAIYVNHDDIIQGASECDALGQDIIGLKPEAIDSNHIIKFVHYNQEVFLFVDKKLVADTSSSTDKQTHDSPEASAQAVVNENSMGVDEQGADVSKESTDSGSIDGDSGTSGGEQTGAEKDGQDSPEVPAETVDNEGGIGADVQPDADKEGVESGLNDGDSAADKGAQTVEEGDSQDSPAATAEVVDSSSDIGAGEQPDADKEDVESGLNDGDSGTDKGEQTSVEGDSQDSLEAPAEAADNESSVGADVQPDTDKDGGDAVPKSDDIDAAKEEGGPRTGKKSGKAKKKETEPSAGQKSRKAKEEGAVKKVSTSKKTASGEKAQSKTEK